jgi:hypothetical protein
MIFAKTIQSTSGLFNLDKQPLFYSTEGIDEDFLLKYKYSVISELALIDSDQLDFTEEDLLYFVYLEFDEDTENPVLIPVEPETSLNLILR